MSMLLNELDFLSPNESAIAGIDEAGRGPLAGPVVAACVVFSDAVHDKSLEGITDSKKLSEKQRGDYRRIIDGLPICYGVGIVGHETIDRINILQATFSAMRAAVRSARDKSGQVIDLVLVDGNRPIPQLESRQVPIVKGDALVRTIAIASVIAKTERDAIMDKYHELYPAYGYRQHKGYGTAAHRLAIEKLGPSPIQRQSFKLRG